jgi:hypothetical protein
LAAFFERIFGFLMIFRCSHERTSFPLTPTNGRGTYVACLECGREFKYDWQQMKTIKT